MLSLENRQGTADMHLSLRIIYIWPLIHLLLKESAVFYQLSERSHSFLQVWLIQSTFTKRIWPLNLTNGSDFHKGVQPRQGPCRYLMSVSYCQMGQMDITNGLHSHKLVDCLHTNFLHGNSQRQMGRQEQRCQGGYLVIHSVGHNRGRLLLLGIAERSDPQGHLQHTHKIHTQ